MEETVFQKREFLLKYNIVNKFGNQICTIYLLIFLQIKMWLIPKDIENEYVEVMSKGIYLKTCRVYKFCLYMNNCF